MATEQDSFAALCQTGGLPWWVTGCKCLGGLVQATFPPCQCKRRNEKDRFGERLRTAQEALMSVIVKVYTIWQSTESGIPPSNCFPSYLRHVPRPWIFVPSRSASSTKCATGATSRPKIRTRKASARQPPTLRAPSLRPRRSAGAGVSRKRCRAPGLKRRNKRRGAAPPSPNRRTAKALRANAAEGAAADIVATSAQLAVTNARLEAELVRLKEQLREAEAEIQNLGGVRRSSLSAESMRTDREAEKEAKFGVSFLSAFKLDLHLILLSAYTPARGTIAH